MRLIFALSAILSLSACAGMLLGDNSTRERAPANRSGGIQPGADSAVSGSIRRQFNADREISQFPIGIRSQGGRVVLTGTVASYDIRDRVVDIAKNTHGVVSVDSRVVVNTNRYSQR